MADSTAASRAPAGPGPSGANPPSSSAPVRVVVVRGDDGQAGGHAHAAGGEHAPAQRGEGHEPAATFGWAWQPELVRSRQKDEYYQRALLSSVTDSLQAAAGPRAVGALKKEAALAAELLYAGTPLQRWR
ncbi:hypothetical protein T484DRAFT_1842595 [Baffinella frigidus]|nr:hypothetical protein T484DRAFT_1842595 [Cryptophyta sp. CCMP2293]